MFKKVYLILMLTLCFMGAEAVESAEVSLDEPLVIYCAEPNYLLETARTVLYRDGQLVLIKNIGNEDVEIVIPASYKGCVIEANEILEPLPAITIEN